MTAFSSFIYFIIMISNGTETLLSTVPYFYPLISFDNKCINVVYNKNQNYKIISRVTILEVFSKYGSICLGFFYSAHLSYCFGIRLVNSRELENKNKLKWKKILKFPFSFQF